MRAESMAVALGGRKVGAGWMARCPVHDDRTPSLSIADAEQGRVLVHCHAGCDQRDVIAALRARGLWKSHSPRQRRISTRFVARGPIRSDPEATERTEAALTLWRASRQAQGTVAARYLLSRGITLPAPSSIRFHPGLKHRSGAIWPGMVALVTRGADGEPIGIHRTFVTHDGDGKAPVEPAKIMLGVCRGGVVRLGRPADGPLMIGEGIETCLAAMQATGHPAWAALSTSGLRALSLPADVRDVIVLADGDDPGEAAAQVSATRWKQEGRRVRIARPPQGTDFNDLLPSPAPLIEEDARC